MALSRRTVLLTAAIALAVVSVVVHWPRPDPLDRFPHAYIAEPGYDPAAVVIVIAPIALPPAAPPGLHPAYACGDPAFADREGRPWLFPLAITGNSEPVPPLHQGLRRRPALGACRPFVTAEGEALLAQHRRSVQP